LFSLLYVVKLSYKLCDLAIDESIFMDDYIINQFKNEF